MIQYFLYVSQFLFWLASLQKWSQHIAISISWSDNFIIVLETFSGCMFANSIYYVIVCLSVCLLPYSLTKIRPTYWHLNFWMRYFWHLPGMFVHQAQINTYFFCFCQSNHWLMKLGQDGDISTSECDIFLKF